MVYLLNMVIFLRYVTNNQRYLVVTSPLNPLMPMSVHSLLMPCKYQPPFRGAPPAPQFFLAFAAEFSEIGNSPKKSAAFLATA
jgi:hypothetical protein